MTNKVLREKSNCIVCQSNKLGFLKQKHSKNKKIIQHFTDCYKNKMKTYCLKCKKNTENLKSNIFETKNGGLLM